MNLPEVVNKDIYVFLFLDTKVFREVKSDYDRKIPQNDIDRIVEWSNTWLLKFHPDKCKVMKLGNKINKDHMVNYKMGAQNLDFSDMEKDLGIQLSFESHINTVVNKANRTMAIIRKTYEYMDATPFGLIFKGLVRPILEYAAPVWSPRTIKYKEILKMYSEGPQRWFQVMVISATRND